MRRAPLDVDKTSTSEPPEQGFSQGKRKSLGKSIRRLIEQGNFDRNGVLSHGHKIHVNQL